MRTILLKIIFTREWSAPTITPMLLDSSGSIMYKDVQENACNPRVVVAISASFFLPYNTVIFSHVDTD